VVVALSSSDKIAIIGLGVATVGSVIAVVGVWVALVQVRRTKSTAEAAAKAAEETQRQFSGAMLLSRTSDLEGVEDRLRQQAGAGDRAAATATVRDWRRVAPEYQALMRSAELSDDDLAEHLELSLGLVDVALEELDDGVAVAEACKRILREISLSCATSRGAAIGMMLSP
jgi:hypothetical protein